MIRCAKKSMRKALYVFAVLATLAAATAAARQSHAAPLQDRWVYLATNLLVDKNVDDAVKLLERAAAVGNLVSDGFPTT